MKPNLNPCVRLLPDVIYAIGNGVIAGEQLIKLMTLGLTEQEAEEQIVSGFLK